MLIGLGYLYLFGLVALTFAAVALWRIDVVYSRRLGREAPPRWRVALLAAAVVLWPVALAALTGITVAWMLAGLWR